MVNPHLTNDTFFGHAGGLFHPADDRQEVAFRYAVERINADRTILPRSRLSAQIEKISPQDSFHASKRAMLEAPSLDCIVDSLKSNQVMR
uniref:Uncharacterized protein n=1 Tax=Timema genevievae TaxID=629358 RepID=A0A7R9JUE8_TIMGE|nr:unnamed protein product [Timema genevievae]